MLRSLEGYLSPEGYWPNKDAALHARNIAKLEAWARELYSAGQRQGWLDISRRDKTADEFADGLQAGLIIGENRVASREAAIAAAKEKGQ